MRNLPNKVMADKTSLACTSLRIKDKENRIYHGRTMEYSMDFNTYVTYYPQGTTFQHTAPDHTSKGLEYTAKYDILCITLGVTDKDKAPVEGVNSASLSASMNMKPDSDILPMEADKYKDSVPFIFLMEWALATCSSVEEVRNNLGNVAFWTSSVPSINISNTPFHYVFYDTTGACIVVEVSEGKLHIYDNPTGAMTNAPAFPWHLTNLNNYTHLSNIDISAGKLGNLSLSQPDTGIATVSLPPSDTSVDRFIRAVFYTTFAYVADSADQAMLELSHIMNKFDRPKNMTVSSIGEGGQISKSESEFTLWTALIDLSR